MEAYLEVFVNLKQNNWARLLSIAEFAYNNSKNASTNYTPFKLNFGYHSCIFYKKDINLHSRSKSADKLANELKKLIATCRNNLQHAQDF